MTPGTGLNLVLSNYHILNLIRSAGIIYELRSVVHSDLYWTSVEQSGDCSLHLLEYMPMQYVVTKPGILCSSE